MKKVNVLGTEYTIEERFAADDEKLKDCDGYCDKTSHKIVVTGRESDCELDDFPAYQRKIMRHEIIHAFLFESGLHENWRKEQWGHDETTVDWIASQFPKMVKCFREAGCLE